MSAERTPDRSEVSGLLLAAGQGERLGAPKAFLEAGGRTLLERVVDQLRPYCSEIVVGVPPGSEERAAHLVGGPGVAVLCGGASRQDTVARLLAHAARTFVLVHEVARPFVPERLFHSVLAAAATDGAACLALPASLRDAVGMRDGDYLMAPLTRESIVLLQTPQAFARDALQALLRQAASAGWREASLATLAARAGVRVRVVEGAAENVKITFPDDWEAARRRLAGPRERAGEAP